MKSVMTVLSMFMWVIAGIAGAGATERTPWTASEVVTSYVNGTSPTLILGLDNNLEICLALREPQAISELRSSGVRVTDSQLVILQLWRLVERTDDGIMRCTVPIIEAPVTTELDDLARAVTFELVNAVGPDVDGYLETVREAGWSASSYSLLGSFVLDGLVWNALEGLEAIGSADASDMPTGSEHWSGVAWITLPPQAHKLGTNSHHTDDGTFSMTWTPSSLSAQKAVGQRGVREALTAMASGRRVNPENHAEELERLGLVGSGGVAVPVIRAGTRVCAEGGNLARQVARALVASEPFWEMMQITGAQKPSVALIMAYHWVYPRLMSQLEADGLARPPVLDGKAGASLAPTVYVVEPNAACGAASD